jgi:hypothetical protein
MSAATIVAASAVGLEVQTVRTQAQPMITPLEQETRSALTTAEAAHHLSRTPQTLRRWACFSTGPLYPIHVRGRLYWPVRDIKRLMGVSI